MDTGDDQMQVIEMSQIALLFMGFTEKAPSDNVRLAIQWLTHV